MTQRTTRTTVAALLLAFLALAPAASAAPDKAHLQLMADIRMLQEQTAQLQLILGSLGDALKAVTAKLDDQAGINRKAFADQKLLIDNLSGDVRVVREKVDDTNVRITSLSTEMEALRLAIPRMITPPPPPTTPDPGVPAGTDPTAPPVATVQAPPPPPPNPGVSPQRMYDTAYADYAGGQWSIAIEGFQNYIRNFPRTELADDAQYMIGDTYILDKKYREAVAAYDTLIKNYPTSNKLPDAYYKRGVGYEYLGQIDLARASYEFAAKTYPESDAGRLAKQNLERLKRDEQDD